MKITRAPLFWSLLTIFAAGGAFSAEGQAPAFLELNARHDGYQDTQAAAFEWPAARREGRPEAVARLEGGSPRQEVGFFYDELEPYGEWVKARAYGWAFRPYGVGRDWRPYTRGRWALSEHGVTWVSAEPFGWATYHYGRWTRDGRQGWLWLPGALWGPAWVSWRVGGGHIGWAPLPPSVGFETARGIGAGAVGAPLKSECYSFVPEKYFLEPRLAEYLAPRIRNHQILGDTTDSTSYAWVEQRVVNRGFEASRLEELAGHPLVALRLVAAGAKQLAQVGELEMKIYRPEAAQLATVNCGPRADAGQGAEIAHHP